MLTLAALQYPVAPESKLRSLSLAEPPVDPAKILEDYSKNIATVTAYMEAAEAININIYGNPPDWFNDDFKNQLLAVKTEAGMWFNSILSKFKSVPNTITSYDRIYKRMSGYILDDLDALLNTEKPSKDPEKDKAHLIQCIAQLKEEIGGAEGVKKEEDTSILGIVRNFMDSLDHYIKSIKTTSVFFQDTKKKANILKGEDEKAIEVCNNTIAELKKEIKKIEKIVLGTGIAGGVALAAAPLAMACAFPLSLIFGVVFAAAAAALLITAIVENAKIPGLQAKISAETSKMSDLAKTVASLNILVAAIDDVLEAATKAESSVNWITKLWNDLSLQIDAVLTALEDDNAKTVNEMYDKLKESMVFTDASWQALVNTAAIYEKVEIIRQKEPIVIKR